MTYEVRDEADRPLGTVWRTRTGWSARNASGRTVVDDYPGSRAVAASNLRNRQETEPMSTADFAQIHYSLDGGHTWHYGRSIEGWVLDDKEALRIQRRVVCENARAEHGNVLRVMTSVRAFDADGNPL
jgi:hypothetical protein